MGSRKCMVICGGGAIGAAIAYFMSRRGARPIVIERHEVAGAASGKSGGFLALDWCRGSALDRLARRSFELHAQLSSELGDPWGYRRVDDLQRLRRRGRYRARSGRATVAGRRGHDHGSARLNRVYGGGRAPRVHDRFDARRSCAWRDAAARYGRRFGARPERRSARRRARERRDRRRRRRRDRDGTVVDPGRALAAAAGGAWLQGP